MKVVISNPGINYNKGGGVAPPPGGPLDDDPPDEIYELYEPEKWDFEPTIDGSGRILDVKIRRKPPGVTRTPQLRVRTKTGVNFSGCISISVVRDPIDVEDPDTLLQVTDLVGLKQTGYIQGRAYYGSVYYKDSIPYAGITETAGTPIQVYATLQESIDAQVTTPPSAIQRQGTDVTSNDPRLNIPGTPDNLI